MKTQRTKAICSSLLLCTLSSPYAHAGYWQTTVVGTVDPSGAWPKVSDGQVAWNDGIWDNAEIIDYKNGVTTRLTNNQVRDNIIGVAGSHIAWTHYVPSENGNTTVNLVLDGKTIAEGLPYDNVSLSPSGLAWADGSNVFFYDGSETHTITYPGTIINSNPNVSGSRIIWFGLDQNYNYHEGAYLYDGAKTVQLPDGVGGGQAPRIDGDNVSGEWIDDTDHVVGVTRYNIATGRLDRFPTIGGTGTPDIAGNQMAWLTDTDVPGVYQLFALDLQGIPVQLTQSGIRPGVSVTDSFVAWNGAGPDGGVFTFDGKTISRLPFSDASTEVTDGDKNTLVLLQPDGLSAEIILATYVAPEPSSMTMAGIAFLSYLIRIRPRRQFNKPDVQLTRSIRNSSPTAGRR